MPSNLILPEGVRDKCIDLMAAARKEAVDRDDGPDVGTAMIEAVAPLIIEWARKDQAEVDALIAEASEPTYGNASAWVNPGNQCVADALRAQFTPETTGGTTNG